MSTVIENPVEHFEKHFEELEAVTIRFAGDSGDGMQLTGTQFTNTSAVVGNDISTLPDFPAEIRAPAGSLPGVSGFQLNFSSQDIKTPGDQPSVLVAMNPAALKVNLRGSRRRRHDHRQYRRLHAGEFEVCELRFKSAGGWLARRLSRAQAAGHDAQHECVERQR